MCIHVATLAVDDTGVVDTGIVVVAASRYVCRLNIVLVWEAGGSC